VVAPERGLARALAPADGAHNGQLVPCLASACDTRHLALVLGPGLAANEVEAVVPGGKLPQPQRVAAGGGTAAAAGDARRSRRNRLPSSLLRWRGAMCARRHTRGWKWSAIGTAVQVLLVKSRRKPPKPKEMAGGAQLARARSLQFIDEAMDAALPNPSPTHFPFQAPSSSRVGCWSVC
jgi:hypothetical protein